MGHRTDICIHRSSRAGGGAQLGMAPQMLKHRRRPLAGSVPLAPDTYSTLARHSTVPNSGDPVLTKVALSRKRRHSTYGMRRLRELLLRRDTVP